MLARQRRAPSCPSPELSDTVAPPTQCCTEHVVGQRSFVRDVYFRMEIKTLTFVNSGDMRASLVCSSQRGEDVPPNLRPGERRSEEARRQHFCYLTFRGYHQAGSTIVQEMLCAFEPRNEYIVQSLLSFMIGWPRRRLTFMFTQDLAFPAVRLFTVLVCVFVVDLLTHFF